MTSFLRVMSLLSLLWLFGLSVVAPDLPELQGEEKTRYAAFAYEYPNLYDPFRYGVKNHNFYRHFIAAHPDLEAEAFAHARLDGNGPYAIEHGRKASYAMTHITGDSRPGRKWNLWQNGQDHHDITFFWRIDRNGAKLRKVTWWTAGARPNQAIGMQEAINAAATRLRA